MSLNRIAALLAKEAQDLWRTRSALLPALLMLVVLAVPFLIALGIPRLTGESMAEDGDIARGLEGARAYWPEIAAVSPAGAVEAFIFQQFLMMVVLVPVTGSMSLAAHSIIGEKQGRTLEPLLATPLTTAELLVAKVLAALLPALALEAVAAALYFGGIAVLAQADVLGALVTARTLLVLLLLAPLATLIALQIVVIASSRVNDLRAAQQFGTLIVLPIVALMIAQGTGSFWLTVPMILLAALALFVVWALLLLVGIGLFDREQILTRWK